MDMISAKDVVFRYVLHDENNNITETRTALSGLSLQIEKGSFVCLLGHNGSGKSSFARLINALNLPDEGTILVSGMDTGDPRKTLDIRKTAGMVFQNPDNQIVANIVEEDVAFGPENLGVPSEEIVRRVDACIEALGMTAFRLQSPNRLSGGQKQRVAIAGVMAMKPECIILDEPTAMLDPSGRKYVLEAVRALNRQEGITVVLITHYMEEAIDADRVIVLDAGNVAAGRDGRLLDGTPAEIFARVDDLKAHSLDVPIIAGLAARLREGGLRIPEGILTRKQLLESLCRLADQKDQLS